jgi:uncharacterized protein YbaP (TraB family)
MTKRSCLWFVVLALALAASALAGPAAATATRPFLWKLESPRATAYLFGSLHAGRSDLYPLDPAVYAAFDASDQLVVEANPLNVDQDALTSSMLLKSLRLDGDSYQDILEEDLYRELSRVARRHKLSPAFLDRLKPWYLAQLLGLLEMKRLGIVPEHGIDRHLILRAGEDMPVLELEGIEKQLEFLNSFSEKEQLLMLEYTLRDIENLEENMNEMTAAWRAGDADRLDGLLTGYLAESPGLEAVFERLFTERDRDMSKAIEDLLKEGGTYFIVVGAGHLVAEEGIIKRLEAAGHKLTQVE